ncbi:Uncharacterized protein FWK35_00024860 [Aphis craccivora]|uniref:HAT C-terminal dimerisation domain-containing protein n=1 Tax=Aphis craccivora TaxID=307492 RepID=A0A6G0W1C8_APHCR|nr:Uncharacterized protein FWK35_00024860 [Aphis craccivora]
MHNFSVSNSIISEITDDVKNKLISLKIDCVKRHFRSIMGVNIQYIKYGKVCLATLAMRELLDVLKAFNIRKEQIYTITCDNASNMVKLARIMNEECEVVPNDEEIIVTNPNENNDDSDFYVEYENQDGTPLSVDDIENELFNDQFVNTENTNEEVEDFQDSVIAAIEPKSITSCIRCSVHSLQLCVLVGLKNAPITNCINEVRKIVKKLRTPKYAAWLKRKNLKYAIIDIETRWNSLYNMLYRLLELKEFCKLHEETNSDLKLNNCEWDSIQSIVNALNPVKIATVALQRQDLNLGDLWDMTIKTAMEKEIQEKYLRNGTFLAAIFLDPRYQALLTSNQKSDAINRLIVTWETMLLLNGADLISESSDMLFDDTVNTCAIDNNLESEDPFEEFLSSQSSVLSQLSTTSNPAEAISTVLNSFNNVQRISHTTKIIEYWETQKELSPELYQLASVALAVPATQVSVERSFSGLKFIVSDLRASLDPDVLEAIMIIRCNLKKTIKYYFVNVIVE